MKQERILYFDVIRIIACLMIVLLSCRYTPWVRTWLIPVITLLTFVGSFALTYLLSLLPFGDYLVGYRKTRAMPI